ncbi:MAG: hypothetical protein J2O48_13145 [Solirubrobacterales bacterium]|nr:hypothetical protein [Solirubrobacterales bacterium]
MQPDPKRLPSAAAAGLLTVLALLATGCVVLTTACGATGTHKPKRVAFAATSAARVSGVSHIGDTLSSTAGGWSLKPRRIHYTWQRCNTTNGPCQNISSAKRYTIRSADGGKLLRTVITADGAHGASGNTWSNWVTVKPYASYWGADYIGSQFQGAAAPWNWDAVSKFQSTDAGGKAPDMVGFGISFIDDVGCKGWGWTFGNVSNFCYPSQDLLNSERAHGTIPFVSLTTEHNGLPRGHADPDLTDAAIEHGSVDNYVNQLARYLASWGHPMFLRLDQEFNGNWFPWAVGGSKRHPNHSCSNLVKGGAACNRASDFVGMWQRIHHIFACTPIRASKSQPAWNPPAGCKPASNVSWVWTPNVDTSGKNHQWNKRASLARNTRSHPGNGYNYESLRSLYPGGRYVNWTGFDLYNYYPHSFDGRWHSFTNLADWTYHDELSFAPSKPQLIPEVGTSPNPRESSASQPDSKAHWITSFLSALPRKFPDIAGFMWFESQNQGTTVNPDANSTGIEDTTNYQAGQQPSNDAKNAEQAFAGGIANSVFSQSNFGSLATSPIPTP